MILRRFRVILPSPFQKTRQILIDTFRLLAHLDQDTFVQFKLISILNHTSIPPMGVADKIARDVVHHDALVESVKSYRAILPAFGFAP